MKCFPNLSNKMNSLGKKRITEKEYKEFLKYADNDYLFVGNFVVKLSKVTKTKETQYFANAICSKMEVVLRKIDIDTGKIKIDLKLFDGKDYNVFTCDRDVLTHKGCNELMIFGASFNSNRSDELIEYLLYSDLKAETENVHVKLGWNDDCTAFKASKYISDNSTQSTYSGSMNIVPKGSKEKWFDMINKEVIGNTALEFSMLLGFSSSLLSYLNHSLDLGSIVFNFSNRSSKGKTTAEMLAISAFGHPQFGKANMITFNATSNALIYYVANFNSYTVGIDEAATADTSDFRKLLYTLCSGKDKLRLNKDTTNKESLEFSSVIITTSEFELIDDNAPEGICTRVFEIKDELTSSASNSDSIKRTVNDNYGIVGEEFVRFLVRNKLNCIEDDYYQCKKELNDLVKIKREFTERVFSKLAIILLTEKYFNECFEANISVESLKKYLLKLETNVSKKVSPDKLLVEYVVQFYNSKKQLFKTDKNSSNYGLIGKLDNTLDYYEIAISSTELEKLARARNFVNLTSTLKILKNKGILITEKDRLSKRIKIEKDSPRINCYVFRIEKDMVDKKEDTNNIASENETIYTELFEDVSKDTLCDITF